MRKILVASMFFGLFCAVGATDANQSDVEDIKNQIFVLQKKISEIEQKQAEKKEEALNQQKSDNKSWTIPGTSTTMSITGFLRLKCIQDIAGSIAAEGDNAATGRNFLTATQIGLDGVPKARSRGFLMSARESRFGICTNSENGTVVTCIEADFLGDPMGSPVVPNNYNPRLRKAYAIYKNVTIGQDVSAFCDMSTFASTVDLNGPVGNCQIRQALIKYSDKFADKYTFDVSMENAETEFITQNGTPTSTATSTSSNPYIDDCKGENRLPDFIGAVKYQHNNGYFRLASMIRQNTLVTQSNASRYSKIGAAVALYGSYDLQDIGKLVFQTGVGTGVGRYFTDSLKAATFFDGQKLHNQNVWYGSIGYVYPLIKEHNIRIGFSCGYLRNYTCKALRDKMQNGTITADKSNGINKSFSSAHVNVIGDITKNISTGVEYLTAQRKSENGKSGSLNRLVFFMQVNF